MKLTVSGLDAANPKFDHLFGRYVYGFRPWTHCDKCLVANREKAIFPKMLDRSIELEDRLFYLCGVGQKHSEHFETLHPEMARRVTNVHFAVRPKSGSIAEVGSAYGVTFVIRDAQSIPIETLPCPFRGLPPEHSKCKNFQFGYQMFNVGEVSLTPGEIVHELREGWRDTGLTLTRRT